MFSSKKSHRLVSLDIGTSSIKAMELDVQGARPKLLAAASVPTPAEAIKNNAVSRPDLVAAAITTMLEANDIAAKEAIICLPGPTAFTKLINSSASSLKEINDNIAFEAGNYIPHKISSVFFDYQVIGKSDKGGFRVMLVAVKNEIVESYLSAVRQAGLEPIIADVDYFALENMFEINYPDERDKTQVLVDIGAKYASVNIMQGGQSIFVGDVGVGGRLYTEALAEQLQISIQDAENLKLGGGDGKAKTQIAETLDRINEHIASELHRQIGFYWNAAATEKPLEAVYISGGGSVVPGFIDEVSAKTGLPVHRINPFRNIECGKGFDEAYLAEISPAMATSVGLASRRTGDKVQAAA
ncbi:MAG: type IV pilus assembly protein PilM [bacterium]|nr:type IV pilus assembly protein PilM [bacterium]